MKSFLDIYSTDLSDEDWEEIEKAWAESEQDEWLEIGKLLHSTVLIRVNKL